MLPATSYRRTLYAPHSEHSLQSYNGNSLAILLGGLSSNRKGGLRMPFQIPEKTLKNGLFPDTGAPS